MKTSNILVVGALVAGYLYKDEIFPFLDRKMKDVKNSLADYAKTKIGIAPSGLPRVDYGNGVVKLYGKIEVVNKTDISLTLNSYKLDLVLKNTTQEIIMGSTPVNYCDKLIKSNSKTAVDYLFQIELSNIQKLIESRSKLEDYKLFLVVRDCVIDSFSVPKTVIELTGSWKEIVSIIRNPSLLLTQLLKS